MHDLAVAVSLSCCAAAHAFPQMSMSYLSPSGVIAPTDSIEVWVHVSSDRLISDTLGLPFGFDMADLPTIGSGYSDALNQWVEQKFATYTALSVGHGWSCSPSCDIAGYDFHEWYGSTDPQRRSFMGSDFRTLQTGDFLVGTYVPKSPVAPGTYTIPIVPDIQFNVHGFSASGQSLVAGFGIEHVVSACNWREQPACSMTRTVMATAVPEPDTFAYGLLGAAALGFWRRHVRRLEA